ncbi:MAG: hypothetical protein H6955_01445 [Chromatiaceae bacterium]|nr:hypothetical protein [Chromatiaceae bacterium]
MHVAYRQRRSTATRNTLTAWLLVAGLLASPLLTYLATPLAQRHADGVWTVLCTLKGNEPVFIALAEGPGTGEADSADCPALQMLQMFGHATPPAAVPGPNRIAHLLALAVAPRSPGYFPEHFSAFPTRGPPLA